VITKSLGRDEMFEVRFPVTAEHIAQGEAGMCWRCPISHALNEIFPGLVAETGMLSVILYEKQDDEPSQPVLRAWSSDEVQHFINRVDYEKHAEPTRFELEFKALVPTTVTYEEGK
jgi:hypothetical protein